MKDKIRQDIKSAMKQKDELRLSVLRMLGAVIQNREIEKKAKGGEGTLRDEEVVATIRSEIKKRKDAADGFEKGGRRDAAEKERAEAKILEEYLPQDLSDEEIEKIAREAVRECGEVTMKEFGKVMGVAMKKVAGRASGDRVSGAVKKILQT